MSFGSFFKSLLGGSSDTKQTQNSNQSSTQTTNTTGSSSTTGQQTQQNLSTQNTSAVSQGQQQQNVSTLSDQQKLILDQLLSGLASGGNIFGNATGDSAQLLTQIAQSAATGANINIDDIVKKAQGAAELSFRENEVAQTNQIANDVGGAGNALVSLIRNRGSQELATRMGGIEANTRLQGAQLASQASVAATQAGQAAFNANATMDTANLNALLQGLGIAKGSTVTGNTQSAQTAQTETNLLSQLVSMLQQDTQTSSSSTTTGSSSSSGSGTSNTVKQPGLIDFLALLTR